MSRYCPAVCVTKDTMHSPYRSRARCDFGESITRASGCIVHLQAGRVWEDMQACARRASC